MLQQLVQLQTIIVEQLRAWADDLHAGLPVESIIAGMRGVANDIQNDIDKGCEQGELERKWQLLDPSPCDHVVLQDLRELVHVSVVGDYWTNDQILFRLVEELGEFAAAHNRGKGDVNKEFGDCMFTLICYANANAISISEELKAAAQVAIAKCGTDLHFRPPRATEAHDDDPSPREA